jgi:hypothetical protein
MGKHLPNQDQQFSCGQTQFEMNACIGFFTVFTAELVLTALLSLIAYR